MRRSRRGNRSGPDRSITRPTGRAILSALLAAILLFSQGCGKKGDPQPPFPRGPHAVSDLTVGQEGSDAVLAFSYPDRLLSGQALTDLASVEVYRLIDPPPSLTASRAAPASAPAAPRTDEAPASGARRAALTARQTEEAFYAEAKKIDTLSVAALAQSTRGATIVYHDPLAPVVSAGKAVSSVGYAVVSVRRGGERSPVSNIAVLAPGVAPGRPVILAVTAEEGRVCVEWAAPETDFLGQPLASVGGYFLYRRTLEEDEYGEPLNKAPLAGTSFVDVAPPQGKLLYTIRAVLAGRPKIEGPPALEAGIEYRDVFPPPAPARLDALSEGRLVRLVWDPVAAADLAGYAVFRADGDATPVRLNRELVTESSYKDETAQPGRHYRYTVSAVDKAGNQSPASPVAVAEVF